MEKESFGMLMETFLKVTDFCIKKILYYIIPLIKSLYIYCLLGQWADDKANGYGVYIHVNGAKYEGQWKNDLQDGYGIETWADGSRYEGYYREGKKHGEGMIFEGKILIMIGTYIWADGSKYNGSWQDNKISGYVKKF